MSFKKFDGSAWQPITPKQLKGVPYTGVLPATLTGTKAGYLHRYKIYGNLTQNGTPTPENPIVPSECGERTGNLCDESTFLNGYYETTSYQYYPNDNYRCFSLSLPAGTYTIFAKSDTLTIRLLRVSSASLGANPVNRDNQSYAFTLPVAETIYVSLRNSTTTNDFTGLTTMLNTGITPRPYEPYGYKLPLTSAGQSVDIYIGDDTLSTEEYVDYGEQKIYKWTENLYDRTATDVNNGYINNSYLSALNESVSNSNYSVSEYIDITAISYKLKNMAPSAYSPSVCFYTSNKQFISGRSYNGENSISGLTPENAKYARLSVYKTYAVSCTFNTLTPTDPPVPFPQIPTSAGSTTISWAGSGLAPSEFDSIQEWVNIPTYKRVNGEWVEDN